MRRPASGSGGGLRPIAAPIAQHLISFHSATGEILFSAVGVFFQAGSIVTESFRLCLIQILLQARGIKLNPVTTLYYVAPACFGFLSVPFAIVEMPKIMNATEFVVPTGWLMASAVSAFGACRHCLQLGPWGRGL